MTRSYEQPQLPIAGLPEQPALSDDQRAHWERAQADGWRKYERATQVLGRMGGTAIQQEILFSQPSPMERQAAAFDNYGVNAVTQASTEKRKEPNPSDAFARVPDTANID